MQNTKGGLHGSGPQSTTFGQQPVGAAPALLQRLEVSGGQGLEEVGESRSWGEEDVQVEAGAAR